MTNLIDRLKGKVSKLKESKITGITTMHNGTFSTTWDFEGERFPMIVVPHIQKFICNIHDKYFHGLSLEEDHALRTIYSHKREYFFGMLIRISISHYSDVLKNETR